MDYTPISQRRKLLIIVCSILVHILLLILMFIAITGENPFESSRHLDEIANILGQSPQESEDATVVFYDEPSVQEVGAATITEPVSQETAVAFDPYAQKQEAQEEEKEAATDTTESADATETQQEIQEHEQEAVRSETPYRTEVVQQTPPPAQKAQQSAAKKTSGVGNLTMADITKGFLKSMAQESGGRPTSLNAEQLARQRYGTRVWSLLRQSYIAYRTPTQLHSDIHTQAMFVLTIDKAGKLISAELRHPKKTFDITQIENTLLNAVRKAGLFPPIPKQFDIDTITLSYPLGIKGHQGTHTYDLLYE